MNAVYPNDLYFEIASLRGQDLRNEAAHERVLRQAARNKSSAPADPNRDTAYRRLAIAIVGLDISTLTRTLRSVQH
ncbi:MAG TPA: hypothetical protein VGJ60_21185 [Chloroflexota bacterium]|jgi:hypothetical protein